MHQKCLAQCPGDTERKAYEDVLAMSKALVEDNDRNVSYPPQSLFVARAMALLDEDKKAVFLQLDPGNGKTFVGGLAIKMIHKANKEQQVTVVLANEYLRKEAEDTNDAFKHEKDKVHFVTVTDLDQHWHEDHIYIVDETWACLCASKVWFDEDCSLAAPWACGTGKAKTIFLCGTVDDHTKAFYDTVWPNCAHLTCGRNSDYARDVKETARFAVKVPGDATVTQTALFKEIRQIVQN